MPHIVLASKSPRRHELLRRMGITDFSVVVPDVEETYPEGLAPQEIVAHIARLKSDAAAPLVGPEDILITADTMVFLENDRLGKPRDEADALRMLTELAGNRHTVCTGVTVRQGGKAEARMKCELIYAEPVVYYMLDSDANKANRSTTVGYLRIRNFDDSAAASVKSAVAALQDSGATSLIIDVRDNTSGKPAEMADSLDYFLPKGDLFLLRDRDGKETTYSSGSSYLNMPMVVLVNENTTCAAEVFACIMQQAGVTVVGRRTPGSAQSQVIVELSDGSAVRLSKFEYLTPDKKSMADLGGVTPDIASYQIEDSDMDVQLEAAKDAVH